MRRVRKKQLKENSVLAVSTVQSSKLQSKNPSQVTNVFNLAHGECHQYQKVYITKTKDTWRLSYFSCFVTAHPVFPSRPRLVSDDTPTCQTLAHTLTHTLFIHETQQDQHSMPNVKQPFLLTSPLYSHYSLSLTTLTYSRPECSMMPSSEDYSIS